MTKICVIVRHLWMPQYQPLPQSLLCGQSSLRLHCSNPPQPGSQCLHWQGLSPQTLQYTSGPSSLVRLDLLDPLTSIDVP